MPTFSKPSPCVGIRTCSDYSPFGVELDGRTVQSSYCSMDNNPILRKDIRGDITDKEERKLRRESKKIQRENLKHHNKEEKWAKNFAKEFNGVVQENKDETGITTYGVKISKITSNKDFKVSFYSSPFLKSINSNNTRLSQIKNSAEGYYYHEGDGWEFAASIGPLSYSRSGDRDDSQFHWNGKINTGHSFDATGLMSKKNWLEIYQAMAFGDINSIKYNYSLKYEWNQSHIWGNW